jgi:HSP20 family molecular chaperone IbpA
MASKALIQMRRKRLISDEIIQSIAIANTLNGGVSEPQVNFLQYPQYREIAVKVPGVTGEHLQVKINNNQLMIFFNRSFELMGSVIKVPQIIYNKPIPYYIDSKKINAHLADEVLIVQLPYNELANGYHRDVPIER